MTSSSPDLHARITARLGVLKQRVECLERKYEEEVHRVRQHLARCGSVLRKWQEEKWSSIRSFTDEALCRKHIDDTLVMILARLFKEVLAIESIVSHPYSEYNGG